jgi:hypothetical protein
MGRQVQAVAAKEFVERLLPIVNAIRGTGATTLREVCKALNERGIRSARGGKWHVSSVTNLLARAKSGGQLPPFYRREIPSPSEILFK